MSAFEISGAAAECSNNNGAAGTFKSKNKLPTYPVGRKFSEIRKWYKEVRQAAGLAGWGPALLLHEKALCDMQHRDVAICMQFAAALYECMSSDSERNEFRDALTGSGDEEHGSVLLWAMSMRAADDSSVQQQRAMELLLKAMHGVKFPVKAPEGAWHGSY